MKKVIKFGFENIRKSSNKRTLSSPVNSQGREEEEVSMCGEKLPMFHESHTHTHAFTHSGTWAQAWAWQK